MTLRSPRQVLTLKKEVNPVELDFLLRFPCKAGVTSPVDFLQHQGWGGIKVGPCGRPRRRGEASAAPGVHGDPQPAGPSRGDSPLSVGPEGALGNGRVQELGQRHRGLSKAMEEVCGVRGAGEGGVPQGVEEQDGPAEAVHAALHAARQDDLRHQVRAARGPPDRPCVSPRAPNATVLSFFHRDFVEEKMGSKYVEGRSVELFKAYKESSPSTPLFFILSPGVDPLKDLELLGEPLPRGSRGAAVRAAVLP